MSFVPQDYTFAVARGHVSGAQPFSAFGRRVTAGAESGVLWPNGTFAFPPTAGLQLSVVSTSADDASAGAGVRTLAVLYLDANLAAQTEVVTLNGTTPVLTAATNIRFVQCVLSVTLGSSKAAAGTISLTNGGATYAEIAQGRMRCEQAVRMVPAGKRLLVTSMFGGAASGTAAAAAELNLATTYFGGYDYTAQGIFVPVAAAAFQDGSNGLSLVCPVAFTAGQSVGMTYTTDKAATVVGSWFGWLENV